MTVEDIDQTLDRIASRCRFSSVELREKNDDGAQMCTKDELSSIFRHIHSSEGKWLIQLVLKTPSPIEIPETATPLRSHFLLPDLLQFQNSLEACVRLLIVAEAYEAAGRTELHLAKAREGQSNKTGVGVAMARALVAKHHMHQ